ncbi:hypothetical protein [uncultured Vibrio sp.]|nr:hypothetical protein [uncultured Vibrio sp.]
MSPYRLTHLIITDETFLSIEATVAMAVDALSLIKIICRQDENYSLYFR